MRYWSRDYNCCIDTLDASNQEGEYVLADITVKHPCLVEIRKAREKDVVILKSRSDGHDICAIAGIHECVAQTNHMSSVKLKVLKDAICAEAAVLPENPFQVSIPEERLSTANTEVVQFHPELEDFMLNALAHRKREDDEEIKQFIRRKTTEYSAFEAETTAQALALSSITLGKPPHETTPLNDVVVHDSDRGSESSRGLSNGSIRSTSTSSIERPRKPKKTKSQKQSRRCNSSSPVSKPALMQNERKSSISESSKKDGGSTLSAQKRVMFSELEPTSIEPPHILDQSETEDDSARADLEQEDMFDMDEQIPVIPVSAQIPPLTDLPGTASVPVSPARTLPFGRQEDCGLSGSFRMRPLGKYELPESSLDDLQRSDGDDDDDLMQPVLTSGTSAPKNIVMPSVSFANAPLSSVKDLPSILPSMSGLDADSFDELDDTLPQGMDRETMWKKAVASSLRLSGLLLPTPTLDDLEMPIRPRQSVRG